MESVKFKPYDKVLVRNDVNEAWSIGLFDSVLLDKYMCMNGMFRYCIAYEGNENMLGTSSEPAEDLAIDTPVMCNCGADNVWHLGFYAGHGEVWMRGCRSSDNMGKCEWYNIVPFCEFNPEDLDGSLECNLVKHEVKKG